MSERHANGILLVLMQPPARLEEEYTDWYDTEPLADRLPAPGCETGQRFVSIGGGPRTYIAIYDLADVHVMEAAEHRKLSGSSFTPRTKRLMRRIRHYRALTEQVFPESCQTHRPRSGCGTVAKSSV